MKNMRMNTEMNMEGEFLAFHTFSDEETASDFAIIIAEAGIEYKLEKIPQILDSNIMGTSSFPGIVIKIPAGEFERANQFLDGYFKKLSETVESDHYLFSFSDQELREIISKPDEWNHFDYQLAQKILADRGHVINASAIQQLKDERKKELSVPESGGSGILFFIFLIIASSALGFWSIINGRANYFPAGLLISIFLGFHLSGDKKILPDGQTVYAYKEKIRQKGRIAAVSSIVLLILCISAFLYISVNN